MRNNPNHPMRQPEVALKVSQKLKGRPKSEETKQKNSESVLKGFELGRVVWNKGLTKETNASVKSTSEKLSIVAKNRTGEKNGFFGRRHTDEYKRKHSDKMKGRYDGENNPFSGKKHTQEAREKISVRAKELMNSPEQKELLRERGLKGLLNVKKVKSRPELMIKAELDRRNISYEHQFIFRNKNGTFKALADFAFHEKQLIVEVQGNYYHSNPKIYNREELKYKTQRDNVKNDERKEKLYQELGWTLLLIWETDINDNVVKCVDKIEGVLTQIQSNVKQK